MNSSQITPRALWYAQEGKCFHCGNHMTVWPCESGVKGRGWTREHLVPKAYTKSRDWRPRYNIVLAHAVCNHSKADKFPTKQEVNKFKEIYKKVLNF